jgi:hypothetical protein
MEELVVIGKSDINKTIFNLNPKTIEEYVIEGRKVVHSFQCHQAVLAYYAMKVCQIKHGGYSKGIYTLKQYAEDIGLQVKTLQNWTLIYKRIVQHLDIPLDKITKKDWQVATKITEHAESLNRIDNIESGTNRRRADYKPEKRTSEEIKKAFKDNYDEQTVEGEVYNWNRSIAMIKNKIQKRDLSLDIVSDVINNYLTKTKKKN